MLSAINAAKSKSISIGFIALKSMILGLILSSVFIEIGSQHCTNDGITLAQIMKVFYLLGCVLDIFALLYFYCTSQFSRLQYYVFYGYHVLLCIFTIFVAITTLNSNSCLVSKQYFVGTFTLGIIFHISSIILMWSTLYFGLKYAHFGSNLVWGFIWYQQPTHCASAQVGIVSTIHIILSFVGFTSFILFYCFRKTSFTAKGWRYITLISLILMLFCYILVLTDFLIPNSCSTASFYLKSYQRYGLIELLSPALILIFLRLQIGDPRQKIIKKHKQIFLKTNENQNHDIRQIQ